MCEYVCVCLIIIKAERSSKIIELRGSKERRSVGRLDRVFVMRFSFPSRNLMVAHRIASQEVLVFFSLYRVLIYLGTF